MKPEWATIERGPKQRVSLDEAIRARTINAARELLMDKQSGSLEAGKWADLVITDGDPLETKTQIKQLFIKGKPVDLDNKHQRLYEKYMNRPTEPTQ